MSYIKPYLKYTGWPSGTTNNFPNTWGWTVGSSWSWWSAHIVLKTFFFQLYLTFELYRGYIILTLMCATYLQVKLRVNSKHRITITKGLSIMLTWELIIKWTLYFCIYQIDYKIAVQKLSNDEQERYCTLLQFSSWDLQHQKKSRNLTLQETANWIHKKSVIWFLRKPHFEYLFPAL